MPMIAVATEEGEHFSIDCDLSMELENVCALLEVDVRPLSSVRLSLGLSEAVLPFAGSSS